MELCSYSFCRDRKSRGYLILIPYMDLLDVTAQQVLSAVDKLNNRPRKCLNFQTPYEVFEKLTGVDVRKIMGYALIT